LFFYFARRLNGFATFLSSDPHGLTASYRPSHWSRWAQGWRKRGGIVSRPNKKVGGSVKKMHFGKILSLGVGVAAGLNVLTSSARAGNLSPGDVAVVQVQGSGDSFSWVALHTIPDGTVLSWTDEGWLGPSNTLNSPSGGGFSGNGVGEQGFNVITVPAGGIPAGTVTTVSLASGLGSGGESVHLFEGTAPTSNPGTGLVWGINWGNATGTWDADSTSSATSALAPVLTNFNTHLGTGSGQIYTGPTSDTQANLIADIENPANWTTSTANTWSGGNFTVVPEPASLTVLGIGSVVLLVRRRNRMA
jgi:hypothetical protein